MNATSYNAKDKASEEKTRCNYIHDYILSSAWDSTILVCLVNMLKRPWKFDVDAEDLDLFDEMREYLFVERV